MRRYIQSLLLSYDVASVSRKEMMLVSVNQCHSVRFNVLKMNNPAGSSSGAKKTFNIHHVKF